MAQTTYVFTLNIKQNHIIKIFRIVENSSVPRQQLHARLMFISQSSCFLCFPTSWPNDVLIATFIDNFKL